MYLLLPMLLASPADAGKIDVARWFRADTALVLHEDITTTTDAAGIQDTLHVVTDTELNVYSGGRYQQHPLRYRAFVRRIVAEADGRGEKHRWDSDRSSPPDPALWNIARRPTTWRVNVDRVGIPTVTFDELSGGQRPGQDSTANTFEDQTQQDITADTQLWLRMLPSTKLKTNKPYERVTNAPPELERDVKVRETWTFDHLDESIAVFKVSAALARPAGVNDEVQTLTGKGEVHYDTWSGVAVREKWTWSMRIKTLREPKRIRVDSDRTALIEVPGIDDGTYDPGQVSRRVSETGAAEAEGTN